MKALNRRYWALFVAICAVGCINVGHDEEIGCFVDPTEPGCKAMASGGGSTGGSATSGAGASGRSGSAGASGAASPTDVAGAAGEGGNAG